MNSEHRTILARPRLSALLTGNDGSRLTTLVAPAGYGKTTLLSDWADPARTAWHTCTAEDRELRPALDHLTRAVRAVLPGLDFDMPATARDAHTVIATLCEALGSAELVLVLDDVHVVAERDASVRLLEGLCQQLPPTARLILSSRRQPPFAVQRLREDGELVELTTGDLAFTAAEIAALTARLGLPGNDSARIHRTTGGWPIAVRLVAEAVRHGQVTEPADPGALFDYVATEIVDHEPRRTRELIRVAARLDRFRPELLAALGHSTAAEIITDLVDRGLFVEALPSAPGWFDLLPLAAEFVRTRMPMADKEIRELYDTAARWCVANDHLDAALAALAALGDHDRIQRLLDERVDDLLRQGGADAVLTAVRLVPPESRDRRTWQLAGEAYQVRGDWAAALDCLQRTVENGQLLTVDLARRIAWSHYLSGATAEALEACRRCVLDGADPVSESLLQSCAASAQWARGDLPACRVAATQAMSLAESCGDDAALAAAHTVFAMIAAAGGDQAALAEHNHAGLRHAERAGDVLSVIRIRSNRASHLNEAGDYRGALTELEVALPLADLTGFTTYRAFCLNNRGEALLGLGQLDEATADLVASRAIFADIGSCHAAVPLALLAETYRLRGDRVLAKTAYQQAIELAEVNATATQLVPALAGLARLLVDDEPAVSAELVHRALSFGTGLGYPAVLLASAELSLSQGNGTGPGRVPGVSIQTLGGFRVLRDGEPVPSTAWQSRKARDLVKILVTRRGRPVTREALISLLWPGERADGAGNRLSVALSTARSVLGGRRGHCVVAEGDVVRLDADVVAVDVLSFLTDAGRGLHAWRHGRPEAWPLLRAAEAWYTGDFLEEDPYEDWATELREEARLTYVQVATVLAGHTSEAGEHIMASRYCLRVLERDRYNEPAHLSLVRALAAAGSHGEARRRYRTYVTRMAEIDIEPRPFPHW